MSRIAKNPVTIPAGVEVKLVESTLQVKGKLGQLEQKINTKLVEVKEIESGVFLVSAKDESTQANTLSGTYRAILANMVKGVSDGFEKKLIIEGVGYRAEVKGNALNLALGYSHPVVYNLPEGIKAQITPPPGTNQVGVIVFGADKQKVGQVAAEIRALREPEPYKRKGIRYHDEHIILKEGKKKSK